MTGAESSKRNASAEGAMSDKTATTIQHVLLPQSRRGGTRRNEAGEEERKGAQHASGGWSYALAMLSTKPNRKIEATFLAKL